MCSSILVWCEGLGGGNFHPKINLAHDCFVEIHKAATS